MCLRRCKSDRQMRITAWALMIATYVILAGIAALATWMVVVVVRDNLV